MQKLFSTFILILIFTLPTLAAPKNVSRSAHVQATLVSETNTITPGSSFTLLLQMKNDPHWHTYWRNGADSGLPTAIDWQLPRGITADAIQWPFPEKIDTPPLVSYGYHNTYAYLITMHADKSLPVGKTITISAKIDWLECDDVCIPGGVELALDIPVGKGTPAPNKAWTEAFAKARMALPLKNSGWKMAAKQTSRGYILQAKAPGWFKGAPGKVEFFPYDADVINYSAPQPVRFENGLVTVTLKKSDPVEENLKGLQGVLVSENGWRGPGSERALEVDVPFGDLFESASAGSESGSHSFLMILLFAFVGGMILNLMPCVLPVLSLKIMGFVQTAHNEHSKAWKHGAVFTLGVLVSFWVLAGILLVLRAGGEQLGWGFQLQSPIFIIVLTAFLFLFGLSMFGVFEIGTSLTTIEGKTGNKEGWLGSFVSGITATVVATPCTAPFMGSALGFALTQPPWASLLVFTFLGLGMATPYVLLASIPSLLKFVPKPGRWMESMKQFMGFLLLATVLWLLWVLAQQAGAMMLIIVLAGLLVLGIAGWIYGRWGNLAMPPKTRMISTTLAVVLLVISLFFTIDSVDVFAAPSVAGSSVENTGEGISWEQFDENRLKEYRDQGQAVFLDFTAAWCLSCQVNDRITFHSDDVIEAFRKSGIKAIKVDWTNRDEKITRALAAFGRNSVPLYVYYPAGKDSKPQLLPELITPGIVLDALQ